MALTKTAARSRSKTAQRARRGAGRRSWPVIACIVLIMSALVASGVQQSSHVGAAPQGQVDQGSRGSAVRPKRQPPRPQQPSAAPSKSAKGAASNAVRDAEKATKAPADAASFDNLAPILAAADFDLVGLSVTASPATQTVPKNTPTAVLATLQVPEGTDPAQIVAGLNPNLRVRGELTGPSLSQPYTIEVPLGQPMPIPPLSQAGDHVLQNMRVVDIGVAGAPVVAAVTPDSCGIVVIERILISEVHVNELSFEQIRQAGIVLSDDSYRAFNFTLGVATTSTAQTISIPVAFPNVGVNDPRPVVGAPSMSGPGIDPPTIIPIMLEGGGEEGDGGGQTPPQFGGAPVRIPGVVVFPGRVGFLHQFFEAIVIVANGAPNGAPLVLRGLHAKAKLPDAGTPGNESDDPLRIAETQTAGRVTELDLHGLGADAKYGTGDDTITFGPGQSGQGTFLLEGLKEGLHTVNFDLEAMLEGLPSGPVKVTGEVPGAVLVRDASFAVTFTHPGIVRAGQQYDLGMTLFNSGASAIRGAFARLNANSVGGAELIGQDNGRRDFATDIESGDSATVKWRLRANVTGAVTASYVKVGEGVSAGLQLVTGVGDRNVPLSPDSLILPDPVLHLPPDVVEAGRALLGQGWSIANAPAGSLPRGVAPVTKQGVINRAVEMGIAGMRVDFGEPVTVSLDTLTRDWLGELKPDTGFADATRNTPAGFEWYDQLGAEFYKHLAPGPNQLTPGQLHQEFTDAEVSRSPFISVLATQAEGDPVFGVRLVAPGNKSVGFGASVDDRAGDLQAGGSLRLDHINPLNRESVATLGQMLVVSNPDSNNWTLELTGWRDGVVDEVSLVYPATSRTARQMVWSGVPVVQGRKYRVVFKPLNTSSTPVLESFDDGQWQPVTQAAPTVSTINQPAPKVVGVIQVTPDVVAGGDKYGRLVGVLFSKPMSRTEAETIGRYKIGGGALRNSNPPEQVGGPIKVTGAHLDYGDRFAFLGLDTTIGPYIDRDLTVSGLVDSRRMSLAPSPTTMRIDPRVSPEGHPPGAYLTGRVMNADGTPVPNARVIYWTQECDDGVKLFPPPPIPIAVRTTDAQGRYVIDYVRDGDCAPLTVSVNNPTTNSEKRLTSPVAYDGQHMVFDLVFLARGNVQGTVTSGGQGVPKVHVAIVPDLDTIGTKVVETDDNGRYFAKDIPVGNVSVTAVGTGDYRTASGLAAGTITGPGLTATINVSLQDISGIISGRVIQPGGAPSPGQLVVAYARIPGFGNPQRADGAIAVGYDFADRDGNFRLANLPIGTVSLEVRDYVTGMYVAQVAQLTPTQHELSGVLITLSGLGGITGHVTNEIGEPVAGAYVACAGSAVRADANGDYSLQGVPAGNNTVTATDTATHLIGSALAPVRLGETTHNINITILRPAKLQGHVYLLEEGATTPQPAKNVYVTSNGFELTTTDAQGAYTINNVTPNAELTLRFVEANKGFVVNTPVILQSGETLVRDATFRPGSIHGRVYQPDGVTTAIAPVTAYVPLPVLSPGGDFGLIDTELTPISVQSGTNGLYQLHGINPGRFRVSTSSPFFPTRVTSGADLAPHGEAEVNLTMVSTLAGKIQGRVFEPDGTTPVGAGVRVSLSGGALAEVTVRTDETGHYEFGEVFSAGGYQLTANDILTGNTNRIGVAVEKNKDAFFDIRLLGKGGLRVRVIDGAGNPATSGSITLDGSSYPNNHRYAEITTASGGVIDFDNLTEGSYAISATQRGLGGRAAATVPIGSTVEVTIQLQASGTVKGKVFMPGGTTPIGLADVELRLGGGRSVGFTVTSDTDEERGSFTFLNVPVGDFTLDVFDNRTGRVGRSAGHLTSQDEIATVNVELLPVGAVTGRVTANGQPVDHAFVQISADGSGLRGAWARATTDPDGRFRFTGIPVGRFTVSVSDAPGGQTGYTTGLVTGTIEPLPDTVADVTLEPSQIVTGTVYKLGGGTPVPGSQVTVFVGGRSFRTATNENGVYRLSFVPLGEVRARAEAPTGYDRGESAPVTGNVAAGTITVDVTLAGTGDVQGTALDSNGTPLTTGTVAYTNDAWGSPVLIISAVQADGHFDIKGAPAGPFSLKLTVPNRVGVGSTSGQIAAAQTTDITVRLEDAGRVIGRVKSEDGSTPVVGADVILTLTRSSSQLRFYAHTNSQGLWSFDNLPLGGVAVNINDVSGAHARVRGLALTTNGQVLDLGEMQVDGTPIGVASVAPPDGAAGVTNSAPSINVTFTEPAEPDSINTSTIQVRRGESFISTNVTLSADGRVATVAPTTRLSDTSTYTLFVNANVEDRAGNQFGRQFRASFTTADETAPTVQSITPANGGTDLAVETVVVVTFDEPLAPAQDFSGVVRLVSVTPAETLAGTASLDATGRVLTFTPSQPLAESRRYTVNVTGQRDAAGNAQTAVATSSFSSFNPAPNVSVTSPAEGQQVAENQHITITADATDNTGVAQVSFTANGANLGADTTAPYSIAYTVPAGTNSLTVTATVTDDLGKTATATRTVEVVPDLGGTVSGTILDPLNRPVALASVTVTAANGAFTMLTAADGRYQFDQVGVGAFVVTATDPASAFRGRASGTIHSFTDNVGLNIQLSASGTVTGTVFSSDTTTPLAGVQVSLYTQFFNSLVGTVTTDAQGRYTVDYVPLGNFIVDVNNAATGDRGRQTSQLNANGETRTVNVVMNGTGRVIVTVRRLSNSVVDGAQVSLTSQTQFGGTQNLTTQADGTATFEHVLAGSFNVSAVETATNLHGSASSNVAAGATSNVTVQLQPAGTITGRVLDVDGTTPRAGLTVRLINNGFTYVVQQRTSGADGGFTFDAIPLETYYLDVLETQDGVERVRQRVSGVTLSTNGQVVTRDLTLIGLGIVTGHVRDESGTAVANADVSLRSMNEVVGGYFSARTDAEGLYTIINVPVGSFNATATSSSLPLRGEANGQVTQHAQTVTADITVFNNSVNLPQYFYDASNFYFDLQGDGSIANGTSGAYTGEYWNANQRGFLLDIIVDGSANRFTGGTLGTREGDGREIALRQNIAGLDVTRKVYTPRDSYFTRYVEILSNPTSNPITVGVRVLSNVRYSYYGGNIEVISTSSGDNALSVADAANPDRWAVVDDPDDSDPFQNYYSLPALGFAFDGENAPEHAGEVGFTNPSGAQLSYQWNNVNIPPGGTVAYLHFGVQQTSRAGANASVERLMQLPPEALAGLDATELGAVRNFAIPPGGVSAVAPLPALGGSFTGRALAGDGTTAVPYAQVEFKSKNPLFGRMYWAYADANGAFGLSTNINDYGSSVVIPVDEFTLIGHHPNLGGVSPTVTGNFPAGQTSTTQDVVFTGTGVITGFVRRHTGQVVAAGGTINVSRPGLSTNYSMNGDGSYVLTGLPPADDYTLTAYVGHPQGSNNTGTSTASVVAGQVTAQDTTLAPTGTVTGIVRNAAGNIAPSVYVRLNDQNCYWCFYRETYTDASGSYTFPDVPAAPYDVQAYEPNTGIPALAHVTLTQDQTLAQDFQLIGLGTVQAQVNFASGAPASFTYVYIQEEARGGNFNWGGYTDGAGQVTLQNVPIGNFVVRGYHPYNGNIYGDTAGRINANGETTNVTVTLPGTGVVTGRVTYADGSPTVSSFVELYFDDGTLYTYTYTDSNGNYTFNQIKTGAPFTLRAYNPSNGNIRRESNGNIITADGQTLTIDLSIPGQATVRVSVLNSDGTPYTTGAYIFISDALHEYMRYVGNTNSSGTFTIGGIPEGDFSVLAQEQGSGRFLGSTNGTIRPADNGQTVNVNITTTPKGTIRGSLFAADGQSLYNASSVLLEVFDKATGNYFGYTYAYNGAYEFSNVRFGSEGFFVRVFSPRDGSVIGEREGHFQTEGEVITIDFTLPLSIVKGTVTFSDGTPVPYPNIYLFQQDGYLRTYYPTAVDELGHYWFVGVPAGPFTLTAQDGNSGLTAHAAGTIGDVAVPVTLDVVLPPTGTISGYVKKRDAGGNLVVVPDAYITLTLDGEDYQRNIYADALGHFSFDRVPLNSFTLKAEDNNNYGLSGRAAGALVNDGDTANVDITLPDSGTVTGTVFREDGTTPVPNAGVVIVAPGLDYERYADADENGVYTFSGIPVGAFSLQALDYNSDPRGYGEASGSLAAAYGTATVNITLLKSATVSGKVIGADGNPVGNVYVRFEAYGGGGHIDYFRNDFITEEDGSYTVSGVPVGLVRADVDESQGVGFATATLTAAGLSNFNITLGGTAFDGLVDLDGADGFRYQIWTGGDLSYGGQTDGTGHAYNGSSYLTLNGNDYPRYPRVAVTSADGREVTSGPVGIDGLVFTRKIFSPPTGGFVRYLEVFTNPSASDITVSAKIEHYTWARSDARVVVSPAANGNHYAVMDSRLGQTLSTAFVMGGPGARAPVTFARFVNGNDYHYFNWRMTVPAGQTRILMHYTLQRGVTDTAGATTQAEALVGLTDPHALDGMTEAEKSQVLTFDVPNVASTQTPAARKQTRTQTQAKVTTTPGGAASSTPQQTSSVRAAPIIRGGPGAGGGRVFGSEVSDDKRRSKGNKSRAAAAAAAARASEDKSRATGDGPRTTEDKSRQAAAGAGGRL